MSLLTKVRGLWRWDGDEDARPLAVSRRSFLFMGGVVAAGAMLPNVLPEGGLFGADPLMDAELFRFYAGGRQGGATLMGYRLDREQYLLRLRKHMGLYRGQQWKDCAPPGEWIFLDGKVPTLG